MRIPGFVVVALCMVGAGVLPACGVEPAQHAVTYPVVAHGIENAPFDVGDWHVTLSRADLALGPVYFCATAGASSTLCPSALEELRAVATIDGLSAAEQLVGTVDGNTGGIHSAAYDFGITWFASERAPKVQEGSAGGHSARFAGTAVKDGVSVAFTGDIDIVTPIQGERVVFGRRLNADINGPDVKLVVEIDPRVWFQRVDFDVVAQGGSQVGFAADSQARNQLFASITQQAPPSFTWVASP